MATWAGPATAVENPQPAFPNWKLRKSPLCLVQRAFKYVGEDWMKSLLRLCGQLDS